MPGNAFQYPLIGSGRCNEQGATLPCVSLWVSVPSDRVRPLQLVVFVPSVNLPREFQYPLIGSGRCNHYPRPAGDSS